DAAAALAVRRAGRALPATGLGAEAATLGIHRLVTGVGAAAASRTRRAGLAGGTAVAVREIDLALPGLTDVGAAVGVPRAGVAFDLARAAAAPAAESAGRAAVEGLRAGDAVGEAGVRALDDARHSRHRLAAAAAALGVARAVRRRSLTGASA